MDTLFLLFGAERHSAAVREWFDAQPAVLGDVAEHWFGRIKECGADVLELMHDGCATACIGEAAFAYVGVFSAHITIGFFRGADLPDPERLLQGTGKRMRHVKLMTAAAVDDHALERLIDAAYRDMKARQAD